MQHSLSRRFIISVVLILLVSQSVLITWAYTQEKESLEESLQQKLRVVARLMVNAGVKGLTEFDVTYFGLLTDEMLKDEDFVAVNLIDDTGIVVVDRKKQFKGTPLKSLFPVKQGDATIGKLQISYTTDRIAQLLFQRMISKIAFQGAILFIIALVIFLYFKRKVVGRIKVMEEALGQMTSGNLLVRINDPVVDELGRVGSGIDLLGNRLAAFISDITTLSSNVSLASMEISATMEQANASLFHQHEATEEISQTISVATTNQTQIAINAKRLLEFSRENASGVGENLSLAKGVSSQIQNFYSEMNSAYGTVMELGQSAKNVAELAGQAAQAVEFAVTSSTAIRFSFGDIERLVAESAQLSEETTEIITKRGGSAIQETRQSMALIHELSDALRSTIGGLGERSKDISKILDVITEITDKTKLLALNASIIAAQAGDHGRGFAVVANEMKMLSDKTAQSTGEISGILAAIHHEIADAVKETTKASAIVKEGSRVADNAGAALDDILIASITSLEKVQNIKNAASLQQDQLQQVASALSRLQTVHEAVSHAAAREEQSVGELGYTIGQLRQSFESVRLSTERQVGSMEEMLKNIEVATGRTSGIANAVHEAQQNNGAICASLSDIVSVTSQTVDAISSLAERMSGLHDEVERLHNQMQQYQV